VLVRFDPLRRFEEGGITLDRRDAVTSACVAHRPGFSFVFGGDGEFYTETVIIEGSNLELADWCYPSVIGLSGPNNGVSVGSNRNN